MQKNILERLENDPPLKELFILLSEELSNSDLQSLLIETFRKRSLNTTPSRVLKEYRDSRFHGPSEIPQESLSRFDLFAYSLLSGDWHSLDLSPDLYIHLQPEPEPYAFNHQKFRGCGRFNQYHGTESCTHAKRMPGKPRQINKNH